MSQIPQVICKQVVTVTVECDECGLVVTYPLHDREQAVAHADRHREKHLRQASPIYQILDEALKDLADGTDKKQVARYGIELHTKVDKATDEHANDPQILAQLEEINDWILYTVFAINPVPRHLTSKT